MHSHEKINYVEFPARDMEAAKKFFTEAFGWSWTDYSDGYAAFSGAGLDGGIYRADAAGSWETGGTLVVFYSEALEATQEKIVRAGGKIVKPVFSFPGGRRFHFADPNGCEFAVWSDKEKAGD